MMLKEIVVEKSKKYSNVLAPFAAFVLAVVIYAATDGMVTAPLVCAFAGALSPVNATAVSVGAIGCSILKETVWDNGFIICSLILITAGKWIMREDISPRTAAFVTFISMAFSGIVFGLVVDSMLSSALLNTVYACVSSASSYFIMQSADILSRPKYLTADRKTLTSLAAAFIISVAVLSGAEIYILNAGVILSGFIILCVCRFFGCYGGVICGVLSTVGVFSASRELGLQTAFFGAAGLAAGFASGASRVTSAALFSGIVLLGHLATGISDISFYVQADIVIASAVFMLVPERLVTLGGRICASALKDSTELVAKEMDFARNSLADVRKNVMDVMTAFSDRRKNTDICQTVCDRVCRKCRNKLDCWEKNFENTNAMFHKIENGRRDILPVGFECISKAKITEEFEKCKADEAFSKMLRLRLRENRNFLFSQMQASEDIVSSLCSRVSVNISKSMTATLYRTLEKYDMDFNSAIVYYSSENRIVAEIYMPENSVYDMQQLCTFLSRELSTKLEYSKPFCSGNEMRLRFYQQTKYSIESGLFQISANESEPSGDTCGVFTDGLGYAYAFVSDGMGQGTHAAVDSQFTATLFKRLMRLGLSCEATVKMINSVMLAKSEEESFATLDIAKINLETGGVTLYKSGACATLIKYNDAVIMFSFASNPVGIIPQPQIKIKHCDFSEGNVIVMMSDGVPEKAYLYIKEQLGFENSLETLSENICRYSAKITSGTHPDDITALCIKLVENGKKQD